MVRLCENWAVSADLVSPTGCYWCGATPLSREDLIPQWLLAVLAEISPSADGFNSAWDYVDRTGDTSRTFPQRRPEIVVRSVCEPCNNGWMSDLEARTMPVLGPLVRGSGARLSIDDQLVLACWAAKTVALLDTFQAGSIMLSEIDKAQIRLDRVAPTGFHIRLGYRTDAVETPTNLYLAGMNARLVGTSVTSNPDQNGFAVTIGIGHVAICVYGGPAFDAPERWRDGGNLPMMVWPPTPAGLSWPPTAPILHDSDELRQFHEGIFQTVERPFRDPDARSLIDDARPS